MVTKPRFVYLPVMLALVVLVALFTASPVFAEGETPPAPDGGESPVTVIETEAASEEQLPATPQETPTPEAEPPAPAELT